jgi:hypothetical protein
MKPIGPSRKLTGEPLNLTDPAEQFDLMADQMGSQVDNMGQIDHL